MEVTSPSATDNEKQLGYTNPNSQTLESLGYAQEVKVCSRYEKYWTRLMKYSAGFRLWLW